METKVMQVLTEGLNDLPTIKNASFSIIGSGENLSLTLVVQRRGDEAEERQINENNWSEFCRSIQQYISLIKKELKMHYNAYDKIDDALSHLQSIKFKYNSGSKELVNTIGVYNQDHGFGTNDQVVVIDSVEVEKFGDSDDTKVVQPLALGHVRYPASGGDPVPVSFGRGYFAYVDHEKIRTLDTRLNYV